MDTFLIEFSAIAVLIIFLLAAIGLVRLAVRAYRWLVNIGRR